VYEERQRDPSWGEQLGPQYREMMLGDALTPVSQLSGAFLRPATPLHLQFAYYEASLVVEYLVERYGHATLLRILDDLAVGMPIHETLERHIGPPAILDEEFAEYAKKHATSLAPELDWSQEDLPERASTEEWSAYLEAHPDNYWALRQATSRLVAAQQWDAARPLLERLQQHYPDDVSGGNSLELLAKLHRAQENTADERRVLEQLGTLDDEAITTYQRIMELAVADEDWETVKRFADRFLAVQPLLPIGHQMLVRSAEATGDYQAMIPPLEALLAMAPVDPAQLHFQLASAYEQLNQTDEARRHILYCLAEAPRYRAAQQLLLRLQPQDMPEPSEADAADEER
jgi:tetratricopeptide (TPR) repeat protein